MPVAARMPVPTRVRTLPDRLAAAAALALVATLAAVTALALPAPAAAQEEGIALGVVPEAVVLETLDGEPVDLGEVIGTKPVLVQFWATWCAICQALHPRMTAAHEAWGDEVEFLVVAAAVAQDQDGVRRHIQRRPVAGRILWDGRGRAARAFEAPGTGYIVILDADGRVAYTGTGPDQDIDGAIRELLEGAPE